MFNFFEQPWTLVGAAVLVLFGVFTVRSVLPEKRRWWQWLLPLGVAAVGFGLDALVQTDTEKINALIDKSIKAVQEENIDAIAAIITDSYTDSFHISKAELLRTCSAQLAKSPVETIKTTSHPLIKLSLPTATATVFTKATFHKDSYVTQEYYASFLLFKVELRFRKQPDKSWLINRVEVLEINRQPVNWRQIR